MTKFINRLFILAVTIGLSFGASDTRVQAIQGQAVTINKKTTQIGTIQKIDKSQGDIRLAAQVTRSQLFKFPNGIGAKLPQVDTDHDGVIDALDAHPNQAGPLSDTLYPVAYNDKIYVFRLNIQNDYVDVFRYRETHDLHENGDNAASFVVKDEPYIQQLVAQAKRYAADDKTVDVEELLLALAKSIPYNADAYTGSLEYPKYPIETLVDHSGDCEDLSILAANLIGELKGYDQAVLVYLPEHIAVGIKVSAGELEARRISGLPYSNIVSGKDSYIYQETTDSSWQLGQLPGEFIGQKAKLYTL